MEELADPPSSDGVAISVGHSDPVTRDRLENPGFLGLGLDRRGEDHPRK